MNRRPARRSAGRCPRPSGTPTFSPPAPDQGAAQGAAPARVAAQESRVPGGSVSPNVVSLRDMETTRQQRIARLIQKDLGEILQMTGRDWFPGAMITVTKVNVTSDLSIARAYLSIFGTDAAKAIARIDARGKEIRRQLGNRVKNQLRQVPELRFYVDDSLDYIENIENLLKK